MVEGEMGPKRDVMMLSIFMGEQEEREAVINWLRSVGDKKPHGTDWRTYYEIADAIELERHRRDPQPETPAAPKPVDGLVEGEKLLDHFKRMQEAAANYLEPTTYRARHPDVEKIGDCPWVREFEMPDERQSDEGKLRTNKHRDDAFIADMIYMLDGPGQRESETETSVLRRELAEAREVISSLGSVAGTGSEFTDCPDCVAVSKAAQAHLSRVGGKS